MHLEPSRRHVHHDSVRHRTKVDEITANPASLPVRPTRQTQLVPPEAVAPLPRSDREHDPELPVRPKPMQQPNAARMRIRR
jgi:hypothetical protein